MADNSDQSIENDQIASSNNDNVPLFRDIYKYSSGGMCFSSEKKRHEFLQRQKDKRKEAFDEKRDLSQLFSDIKLDKFDGHKKKHKFPKKNLFGYKLMSSEWFTQAPEDLSENWLVKFCPEGIRYLVVAHQAATTCYFKNGILNMKFNSKLPGGTVDTVTKFTVLDCIYNKNVNTLFIYDVLAWNSMSLLHAEAQMRFFWLNSKFEDNPEMLEINSNKNLNMTFAVMDSIPAEKELIQDKFFSSFSVNGSEINFDCVLFYHKEGHYIFGRSPLVGWLKTFMVPEVLNIDVPISHLQNKPENYESIAQYIRSFRRKKQVQEVEMTEIVDEEKVD